MNCDLRRFSYCWFRSNRLENYSVSDINIYFQLKQNVPEHLDISNIHSLSADLIVKNKEFEHLNQDKSRAKQKYSNKYLSMIHKYWMANFDKSVAGRISISPIFLNLISLLHRLSSICLKTRWIMDICLFFNENEWVRICSRRFWIISCTKLKIILFFFT